jgi:hypothetical protein
MIFGKARCALIGLFRSRVERYYNGARTHLSLHKDAPIPRATDCRSHAGDANSGRTAPSMFQSVSFRQMQRVPLTNMFGFDFFDKDNHYSAEVFDMHG